ncbi:MAG: DUF86 domain-containing protein [Candidatus Latescibacterota bacterium]
MAAAESVERFVSGTTETEFRADDKTVSAVCRKREIIGEASKIISTEWISSHPEVPWRDMAGMRDRLIHAYFGIDHGLVWRAIKERLPQILLQVREILAAHGHHSRGSACT